MIVVLHIVVLCWFTLRSYAVNVLPASYAWSTFTGPVSGEVQEVKPWKPSSEYESENSESSPYGADYVAKPQYSFAYGVENPNTGDSHGHSETRDGSTVTGEYSVMEPDGVLRRVLYTADPKNGFRASVRYVQPDGEESSVRDHGFHGGHQDGQPPSAEYESDGDDHPYAAGVPPPPPPPPPSSSLAEYESDGDDHPYVPPLMPLSLNFGLDKYNDNLHNDDGDYDDDTGGGGVSTSAFKFPSAASSFLNKGVDTAGSTDDEYAADNEKYRNWGGGGFGSSQTSFDNLPSPPPPFGLSSTSSSPFGIGSPPSQFGLPSTLSPSFGFPKPPLRTAAEPPPCGPLSNNGHSAPIRRPPPLSANVLSYQTSHSNRFHRPSLAEDNNDDDDDFDQLRSFPAGDDDHDDSVDNSADDDNDTDTARNTDVELLPTANTTRPPPPPAGSKRSRRPSSARSSRPPPSTTSTAPTPQPSSSAATVTQPLPPPSSPQPFKRPSPFRRPSPSSKIITVHLSPSQAMTPIEPTIIDINT